MTPFDLIYERLIADYRLQQAAIDSVKSKNLIEYTQESSPEKRSVQTADLPEVVIYLSNVRGNLHASSSTAHFTTTWQYMLSTGSFDSRKINTLGFAAIKSLSNKAAMMALQWNSRTFVKDIRLLGADVGLSNPDANRNIKGWASLLSAEIDLSLLITDLAS